MKKIRYFLPCFMVLSLASCQVAVKLEMTNYESNISFPEIKKNEEGEGFYRLKEYQPLSYGLDNKTINSLRDIYSSGASHYNAPSIGKINALVIPVNFLDSNKKDNDKQKIIIHNAFFGEQYKTRFESLASFYDQSSYGQLEFSGMVTDFYDYPLKSTELGSGTSNISSKVAAKALEWFYQTYQDIDTSIFDMDNDENIDALFIIYNHKKSDSSNSLWWAYADHLNRNVDGNNMVFFKIIIV